MIDRSALASAGWGPRSRVAPPRVQADRPGAAQGWLEPLGLTAVPAGRVIVVTTRDQARLLPVDRPWPDGTTAAWELTVREAAAWGGDRADRFQSVARWREEATPRASAAGEDTMAGVSAESRRVRHFVANGWPESGVEVELVDCRAGVALAWVVGSVVLLLGLLTTGQPRAVRAGLTVGLAGLGLVAWRNVPPTLAGPALGLVAGAVGVACLGLGRFLPWPRPRRWREGRTSTFRRPTARQGLAAPVVATLLAIGLATPWALGQAGNGPPILALLPYDGPPDPGRPPDRVVLRLADYQRLETLAVDPPPVTPAALHAVAVLHRVAWRDREAAIVESDLALESTASSAARGALDWSFPVEDAREIAATLDGHDVAVRIEEGGKRASVQIEPADDQSRAARTHRLVLRRVVAVVPGDLGLSAALTVDRVATARVEVAPHPAGLRAELPDARGRIESAGEPGGLTGWLGPVERLEVRWLDPSVTAGRKLAGSVEVVSLWDAVPAGDRVRARISYRAPGGTSLVRIGLEPGTLVRDATLPAGADVAEHREPLPRCAPCPGSSRSGSSGTRPRWPSGGPPTGWGGSRPRRPSIRAPTCPPIRPGGPRPRRRSRRSPRSRSSAPGRRCPTNL